MDISDGEVLVVLILALSGIISWPLKLEVEIFDLLKAHHFVVEFNFKIVARTIDFAFFLFIKINNCLFSRNLDLNDTLNSVDRRI